MNRLVALFALLVVVAITSATLAGKGGGKPPKDPPTPADPAIAYNEEGKFGVFYLGVCDSDGSNATRIVEAEFVSSADWSPAGDRICFFGDVNEPGLYVVDADGSNLTLIMATASTWEMYGRDPAWCPVAASDGEFKIAFHKAVGLNPDGSRQFDIFLINPNGTGLVNLSNTPALDERSVSWSRNGRMLAFETPPSAGAHTSGPWDICVHSLDAAGTAIVDTDCVTDAGPLADLGVNAASWAKTKDEIVVSVESGLIYGHLWRIVVASPTSPTQITSSSKYVEMEAVWSEDDASMLYVGRNAKRVSSWGGWLIAADGSDAPGDRILSQLRTFAVWRR